MRAATGTTPTTKSDFLLALRQLLNAHSKENGSNTPDFVLAEYLMLSLDSFDVAVRERGKWYGHLDVPGQSASPSAVPLDASGLTPEWCMAAYHRVNPGAASQAAVPSLYLLDFAREVLRSRPAPVTLDAERIKEAWEVVAIAGTSDAFSTPWTMLSEPDQRELTRFASRIWSRALSSSRPEGNAEAREMTFRALMDYAKHVDQCQSRTISGYRPTGDSIRAYARDHFGPLPAPSVRPEPVRLSDGSTVEERLGMWTRRDADNEMFTDHREWRDALYRASDTGADFDAVKAYASALAAARFGEGK